MRRAIASLVGAATLLLPVALADPVGAAPSSTVTGSAADLLNRIPILPKMDIGYTSAAFAKRTAPTLRRGPWSVDFGQRQQRDRRAVRWVDLISPRAAWASGAYGWTPAQRAQWDGARTLLSSTVAAKVSKACQSSPSLTCALDAMPADLAPDAATAIVVAATRNRLSMTREEKARAEVWVDHRLAAHPDEVFEVTTTEVPALPTTDGSDATGRVVDASLFGLLAPPAWNSTPNVPYSTLRLWDSGVLWKDLEPSPGRFTWKALDHAVKTAESGGKKVLLVLGPVPAWASANPESPDESWGKGAPGPFAANGLGYFERYVRAVVGRYGDRIWGYETWNEANLQTFWMGSPAEMAVMTKVVHDVVREAGARSKVLSASATTRTEGSIYRFFPAYLRELAKRGWPVDGFAMHAYPDADGTPSDSADSIAQFKAYLAIAGAPALPIYDTELNYGLAGPGPDLPHRDMTAEQAQGWLSRTFIDAVRLGVAETHWFAWTTKYYGQYGIQLNPTTAANRQAWQTTHDWLVGATFTSCSDPDGAVICAFERDGRPFWLAYADDNALLDLPEGASTWCDLRGACVPTSGSKVVVGVRPIRIS